MTHDPRAIQTDGIGHKTTAHLNLTRTLADVGWVDDSRQQPEAGRKARRGAEPMGAAQLNREIDRWIARNC